MEFQILPGVMAEQNSFTILVAPEKISSETVENNINSRNFTFLYICGNFSRVLSRIKNRCVNFDVRRAFTAFQLLAILEESHHSSIFMEHDPTLYEDNRDLLEYISLAIKDRSHHSTVLLYSPSFDLFLNEMLQKADRIVVIEEHRRGYFVKDISLNPERKENLLFIPFLPENQKTLGEFSWEGV